MKLKKIFLNLLSLSIIVFLYSIANSLLHDYLLEANQHYNPSFFYPSIVSLIFFGGIGIVLATEKIIFLFSAKGKLSINFTKLILLGAPSLYFSFPFYNGTSTLLISLSSLIFGYTLISSLEKKEHP